jgi:hypothetical protein
MSEWLWEFGFRISGYSRLWPIQLPTIGLNTNIPVSSPFGFLP